MLDLLKTQRHAYLQLLGPEGAASRFALDRDIVSIGRGPANTIRLEHASVSQRHCLLVQTPEGVKAVDLESTNGSFVNDRRILEHVLRDGDILQVGPFRLRFHAGGFVPPPPPVLPGEAAVGRPFAEMCLRELRRTPCWLVSLAVHLLALLLLFHVEFLRVPVPRRVGVVTSRTVAAEPPFRPAEAETVPREAPEPLEMLPQLTPEGPAEHAEAADAAPADPGGAEEPVLGVRGAAGRLPGAGLGGLGPLGLEHGLSGTAFGRHLAGLRGRGLDVAVVFDSTGSMQEVIDAVKDRILRLHTTLSALLGSRYRLALVTYRDREDRYVVKAHPFAADPYGALAFLEGVVAGGGDDVPEAVVEGLAVAVLGLKWRPRAAKALLLIGDAPPHPEDVLRCRRLVKQFRRLGGEVHTLFTGAPDGRLDPEARRAVDLFRGFARRGGGAFFSLDQAADVVAALQSLVFGRRYRREAEKLTRRIDFGWQGRLVRRHVLAGDAAWLVRHLRARSVPHPLVVAGLIEVRKPGIDTLLRRLVEDPRLTAAQRNALRYVLLRRRRASR